MSLYILFLILPVFGFFPGVLWPGMNVFVFDPFHLKNRVPKPSDFSPIAWETPIFTPTSSQDPVTTTVMQSISTSITLPPEASTSSLSTTVISMVSSSKSLPLKLTSTSQSPQTTHSPQVSTNSRSTLSSSIITSAVLPQSSIASSTPLINTLPTSEDQAYRVTDQVRTGMAFPVTTGLIAVGVIVGLAVLIAGILLFVRFKSRKRKSLELPAPVVSSLETKFMSRYPLDATPTPVLMHSIVPIIPLAKEYPMPLSVVLNLPSVETIERKLPRSDVHPESLLSPFEDQGYPEHNLPKPKHSVHDLQNEPIQGAKNEQNEPLQERDQDYATQEAEESMHAAMRESYVYDGILAMFQDVPNPTKDYAHDTMPSNFSSDYHCQKDFS